MSSQFATAPPAPGTLGADVEATVLLRYLESMMRWRDQRRQELDALDAAAMDSDDRVSLTPDVTLSMTLWQQIADRLELILATWDSGRVGANERRRITTLVWATLEQPGARGSQALAVSLPEACRLSDSLASSLRSRLRLDGTDPDVTGRLRALRQQVERIADQVSLIPPSRRGSAEQVQQGLDARLVDLTERVRRGADVGGLLGPLESAAAIAERDLIVAASVRAHAKADHRQATREVAELAARGQAVRALAERVRSRVSPAPSLAVPDVHALGGVPADPDELTAYLKRLERVDQALTVAQAAYADAAGRLEELTTRAQALARALEGHPAADDLAALTRQTESLLESRPTDLTRLEALVQAQETFARTMGVTW